MSKDFTEQKMKFSIKDFFSKYDQIRSFLQIWSYLLKKSLMENFISVQCLSKNKINPSTQSHNSILLKWLVVLL